MIGLLATLGAAQGGTTSGTLQVHAVVKRLVRVQMVSRPQWLDLSEDDVAAGHHSVAIPMLLAVDSNSAEPYVIVFECSCEHVKGGQVRWLGREMRIGSQAATVQWPPAGRREMLEFTFRFTLPKNSRAGRYPWPVQVTLSPA